MTQKNLAEFHGSATDSTMDRLLNKDQAVDELTDFQVMDVWVRGKFARDIFRANPKLMRGEESDTLERQLSQYHPGIFKQIAVEYSGRESSLSQSLTWEDDRDNVRALFDRWTKDDHSDPIPAARERIKTALRSCGMPAINIQRNRVQYHTEA